MLEKLMQTSLQNRLVVLLITLGVFVVGVVVTLKLPIDVFPDLTAPTVTIMTEAHGWAPEEIEKLITFPIEAVVNGAAGVRRVRSNSIQGLSTVWVEFDWGTDIYLARQIVNEKLQIMRGTLPEDIDPPVLTPINSMMGEIMLVGFTADDVSPMDLRDLVEFDIARRIQSVPGVSQVLVYGGESQQYQVLVDPYKVAARGLTLHQVHEAVTESNVNATGGILVDSGQEYLIRGIGRVHNVEDIERTVVSVHDRVPVLIKDVADVAVAPAFKIGTASINAEDGVLLLIAKQPEANTLTLTQDILSVLEQIRGSLPGSTVMHTDIFRQADFIETAVNNVVRALAEGALLVTIILFVFLVHIRTTLISLAALPLSLVMAFLSLKLLGLSVNTMTLGGMAIAIGVLVDDAIIYVENVYRRVRQNEEMPKEKRRPFQDVVADASSEIRSPIVMATLIIIVVFIPLFFLGGIEGRMLKPLGFAYVISILASLIVAVTVTPALSSYLLTNVTSRSRTGDGWLVRKLKIIYEPCLRYVLKRRTITIALSALLVILAVTTLPFFGRSFLPEFNEGTFNIAFATIPGTSLKESDELGKMMEEILLSHDAVISTARRTGRTELDEHSLGSHAHEIEVRLDLSQTTKAELLEELRNSLSLVQGSSITIGQPISHRIDHMLSGTRAAIAVKLFGSDLYDLRNYAEQIRQEMEKVPGVVDLAVDLQADVPQIQIHPDRNRMAMYGLHSSDLDELIDVAFLGEATSQVYEGEKRYDLVVRYTPEHRNNVESIRKTLIDTPAGGAIPLEMVADVRVERGPNYISRENARRKIVIQANVAGGDLRGAVDGIRTQIENNITLPAGYFIEYGGQFESEEAATRTMTLLSIVSVIAILVLLFLEFGNMRQAVLVMVNLPLALIGGIVSILMTDGIISIASLVGFITLFGIAVRCGILMVSHYNYLIDEEKKSIYEAVVQGSLERLSPILMTAMTTGLALVPLALAGDKPGSELQSPMAIVILGGLVTSTLLNLVVVPALYATWGRKDQA